MSFATRCLIAPTVVATVLAVSRAEDPKPPSTGASAGNRTVDVVGQIVPSEVVRVTARIPGMIRTISAAEGDQVKVGQVVAELESAEADWELKRASAGCDRARAAVAVAEARLTRHRAEVGEAEAAAKETSAQLQLYQHRRNRLRDLLKSSAIDERFVVEADEQHMAAEQRVRQAEARLAAARAEPEREGLAVARADLAAADARQALARLNADAKTVRSPVTGTVIARHGAAGEFVTRPTDGHPIVLFEVADLSRLDAVAEVPEQDFSRVVPGQRVEVRPDGTPGHVYRGSVTSVAPVISPANRTFTVRVRLDAPSGAPSLRPGMSCGVSIFAK